MKPVPAPSKPLSLDQVIEQVPYLRQSLLAKFDDCALSSYFELRYGQGWTTHPQAQGVIFHRTAAECLRSMREQDTTTIPVGAALAILEEMLEQKDIEPEERVRVPMRDIPLLRMTVAKFARDNAFSVRHIVDIEKRLEAELTYTDEEGIPRTRVITGQPDALIADPNDADGAIIPDWKSTWARPPKRPKGEVQDEDPALSYHGLFQLALYGWLVFRNYPSVQRATLREFYPRRTEARTGTISRDQLEKIEADLARVALDFDRAYASGKPTRLRIPDVAPWNPSPGKHCYFCAAAHRCPIESDARHQFAISSPKNASRAVRELAVADAIRKRHRDGLRPYVEENGPVPLPSSKSGEVFGLRTDRGGRPVLRFFVPEDGNGSVRRVPEDRKLEEALRRANRDLKQG